MLIGHEMAHIVIGDFLYVKGAYEIPSWFNEGIAVSISGEGHSMCRALGNQLEWSDKMLVFCPLDAPMDAFAHGNANRDCYPEYYLAVQKISQIGGPIAVGKILQGLRVGTTFPELILSATGEDYSQFKQDVNNYTADVMAQRKPIP